MISIAVKKGQCQLKSTQLLYLKNMVSLVLIDYYIHVSAINSHQLKHQMEGLESSNTDKRYAYTSHEAQSEYLAELYQRILYSSCVCVRTRSTTGQCWELS